MTERPEPPPEGRLITAALKQSGLSAREAARRAGISEVRWRQIAGGFQTVSGQHIPVTGPADTVARMAHVVGLTHQDFDDIRQDVVDALLEIEVPEAMERSEAHNAESEDIIRRIRHRLSLMSPRQLALIDQLAAELAREQQADTGQESAQ